MSPNQIAAIGLVLIAAIGWINARWLRLSAHIAMVLAGIVGAVALLAAQVSIEPFWGFNAVRDALSGVDFSSAVMDYMLGLLLFASGLQIDFSEMRRRPLPILTFATAGVVASTVLIGTGLWAGARLFGLSLPLPWALVFGALISPTDPIALASAIRSGEASPRIGSTLQGEALFNDGIAVVTFTAAVAFAATGSAPHPGHIVWDTVVEAGGGLAFGIASAALTLFALRLVDDPPLTVIASIALAVGAYVGAGALHMSGPIAAAAAGLMMGGARGGGEAGRRTAEVFWEVIDQLLNAALFLLLGLQVFVLHLPADEIGFWLLALLLTLASRLLIVLPWGVFFRVRDNERGATLLLACGGMRGAISLALALSLPASPYRETILSTTFVVVVFSVVVQGLGFGPLARRIGARPAD